METEVLKYILDNQGAVITADLLFNLCSTSTLSELICNDDKFVPCLSNGTPKVVVRSSVRLCWRKNCGGCGGLHLCKGFLLTGSCQFTYTRRGCIFSHNLHSPYNEKILTEFGLETLSRAQLCLLLLQSNSNILPSLCHNYNNRNGCQDTCPRLHVCEKFLNHDCSCFRTHDFLAPQPQKVLQDKRIPDCLITSLKSIYANKEALWFADKSGNKKNQGNVSNYSGLSDKRAASSSDLNSDYDSREDSLNYNTDSNTGAKQNENRGQGGSRGGRNSKGNKPHSAGLSSNPKHNNNTRDKTEICMFFIKGHCKYEDLRCFKAHVKMPYLWQINLDGQWTPMSENEKIEQAYCYPENTYSTTCPLVYFDTMKCGENDVRRLSTVNSVLEPDFIHTTDWLWYWEDEYGKWFQYGADTSVHQLASVTSKYLEEMYVNNDKAVVQFKAGSQSYELSFQDMIQTNIKYGTKRIVRRRPQFVSAAEVPTKRKRTTNPSAVPDYWDKTQISPTEHKCISLQPCHAEYKEIHDLFSQTMKGFDILKMERIQNKAVWEAFQLQKNHMKNKNNGKPVAEKKLFHGTDPSHVETICATNFDWRLCGLNGTVFGQGSYFARDAKYSHSYTGASHLRFMFVSRVLVGDYTRGRSEYKRPPSKDGSNVNLYDSCVDDITNPSIFVVFEKQQIYPEYVIQYKERGQQTTNHQPAALTTAAPTPAVRLSVAPASSTVSSNALVTNLAPASSTVSSNALVTNMAPASSTVSTKAVITNAPITPSNVSSYAQRTNLATTSPTRPSNASMTSPVSISSPGFSHPLQSRPNTPSSVRSSDSPTFTANSSFRFAATTNRAYATPPRSSTAFSSSSSKQNKCVIS